MLAGISISDQRMCRILFDGRQLQLRVGCHCLQQHQGWQQRPVSVCFSTSHTCPNPRIE